MKKKIQIIVLAVICAVSLTSMSVYAVGKKSKAEQPKQEQSKNEETSSSLVVENIDWGPYMRELQRKIKTNWEPPKGDQTKRVVLIFTIGKDGDLKKCAVYKSSGSKDVDKSAMDAVNSASPFRPLPAGFKNESIDIQFTFDYNVIGSSRY